MSVESDKEIDTKISGRKTENAESVKEEYIEQDANDDDYQLDKDESVAVEDEEEEDDDDEDGDEDNVEGDVEEEEEDDAEVDADADPEVKDEDDDDEISKNEDTEENSYVPQSAPRSNLKRQRKIDHRRTRKKVKSNNVDEESIVVENDEVVTPDDSKGDAKITELGVLLGGRQFRIKTFKVRDRGDRIYAISTDCARTIGYRDSYFLFQKHPNLFRVRVDGEPKMELINKGDLPGTFKTRAAYLVTARSIFKEFGARIILNGRQIIDDYYEDKARENGAIEGAPIGVTSNSLANSPHQSLLDKQRSMAALMSNTRMMETATSWIYDHAVKCRQFESMLLYDRMELWRNKLTRDVYTGVSLAPSTSQPTICKIKKMKSRNKEDERRLTFDTVIGGSSVFKTGLKDIPLEIFDGVVDPDVQEAILKQQKLETEI